MTAIEDTRSSRRQGGSAAVEFALVLPLFSLLVFGAIDFGYFFYLDHIVTNAAREGARAGTLWTDDTKAQTDAEDTAKAYLDRANLTNGGRQVTKGLAVNGGFNTIWVKVRYPANSLTRILAVFVPDYAISEARMRR